MKRRWVLHGAGVSFLFFHHSQLHCILWYIQRNKRIPPTCKNINGISTSKWPPDTERKLAKISQALISFRRIYLRANHWPAWISNRLLCMRRRYDEEKTKISKGSRVNDAEYYDVEINSLSPSLFPSSPTMPCLSHFPPTTTMYIIFNVECFSSTMW